MSDIGSPEFDRKDEIFAKDHHSDGDNDDKPLSQLLVSSRMQSFADKPSSAKTEPIDHLGLQQSLEIEPQEEVVYEVVETPIFNVTRALFIGNLRRPLNAIGFQNYLKQLTADFANETNVSGMEYAVERAWLNRTRTHGIVLLNSENAAVYIRDRLNASTYPFPDEDLKLKREFEQREHDRYSTELAEYEDLLKKYRESQSDLITHIQDPEEIDLDDDCRERSPTLIEPPAKEPEEPREFKVERLELYVDYIPVKVINQWIFEEDKGPRNGKWKVVYENIDNSLIAQHKLLEGDFIPKYDNRRNHPRLNLRRNGLANKKSNYVSNPRNLYKYAAPLHLPPPKSGRTSRPNISRPAMGYYTERSSYVPRQESGNRRPNTDSYLPRYESRSRDYERGGSRTRTRSRSP